MRSSRISMSPTPHDEPQELHSNTTKSKFSSGASSSGSATHDEDEEELHSVFEDMTSSPTQQQRRKKSRTHTLVLSSMRSLHMVKAKLKAKLHAALESRGANGSTGRRPGRAFSCGSAAPSRAQCTRQKRSGSLGARVFRSRSVDRSAHHPRSPPSTSMIFIDC
ncbi:hypothetical protein Gpo141_00009383 [Globisporangium polare]